MSMKITISLSCFLLLLLTGCKKEFIDTLPSTTLVVPSTLSDYQAILDNDAVMDGSPLLGELSADNFYLPFNIWQALDTREHNAYIWAADIYEGQGLVDDWDIPYEQVFYANVVLEGLATITPDNTTRQQWNTEQGSALFIRAYAFYNIAQLFAPVYDSLSASTDMGIPIRLSSGITAPSVRTSVKQTYAQIISDLEQASSLLPPEIPFENRNRPWKAAALAMTARVYLSMRDYTDAGLYADSSLNEYNTLIDYNTVSTRGFLPFTALNTETLYQSSFLTYGQVLVGVAYPQTIVDSSLYQSYGPNDLRRIIFYRLNTSGQPNIKGSYAGTVFPFSGLATDEVYLIRAECRARLGQTTAALSDLNTLLQNRWVAGTFTPITAPSSTAALDSILLERRKELAFRGLRWTDLRRLNKEGRTTTLTRILGSTTYQLQPNDPKYTLPIPPDVLSYNPTMQQNLR